MKTLIIAAVLALTAASAVVVASGPAKAETPAWMRIARQNPATAHVPYRRCGNAYHARYGIYNGRYGSRWVWGYTCK